MVMIRNLKPMVNSRQTRTLYEPVIKTSVPSSRMQQSSRTSSKRTSRTSSKPTNHWTSRGQWRYHFSHVHLDASTQSHGALWQTVRISKQWFPRWGRTLWTSFGLPNVASRKVGSSMNQRTVGHPYVNVVNPLLTTIWFVHLREYRWRMLNQHTNSLNATRTRQSSI